MLCIGSVLGNMPADFQGIKATNTRCLDLYWLAIQRVLQNPKNRVKMIPFLKPNRCRRSLYEQSPRFALFHNPGSCLDLNVKYISRHSPKHFHSSSYVKLLSLRSTSNQQS